MGNSWLRRGKTASRRASVKQHDCPVRLTLVSTGQAQPFEPRSVQILVGRDESWADFVLPAAEKRVGRRHMQFKRQAGGDWEAVRLGDYYIAVNGKPVVSHTRLLDGDTINLGSKDGPALRFELVQPDAPADTAFEVTDFQPPVPTLERALQRIRRNAALVAASLAAVAIATGYLWTRVDEHETRLRSVSQELASREERALEQPASWQEQAETLQKAAHLVVVRQGGAERGIGTAWPVSPTRMITNAHVASQITGRRDLEAIVRSPGASPKDYRVVAATLHSGYEAFSRYLDQHKAGIVTSDGTFRQATLPGAYDVAMLELAPGSDAGPLLELAPDSDRVRPGEQIAFAGYFLRDITGSENAHRYPTPRVHFGNVSAVTNFFLFPPDHAGDALLIHNTIPLTGGTSGGPVVDASGRVVGIVSSGTVVKLPQDAGSTNAPSAAMVNYAQDAGLVRQLIGETPFDMAAAENNWQHEIGKFEDHRQYVLDQFLGDIGKRGTFEPVKDPLVQPVARSLDAHGVPLKVEAGRSYAVMAYSRGAGPVWMRVNQSGREIASDNADAARAIFEAKASDDAEVLLVTNSEDASSVELFVYRSR